MKAIGAVRWALLSIGCICVPGFVLGCTTDKISVTDFQFDKAEFSPDKDETNDTVKITVKTKVEITDFHYNDSTAVSL
ncbi:MAG: hypothetical protein HY897_25570 [Deltaproteobacteria bacterium]|nr:hypothetical protein [Deltaproteobacteria bacterium]